MNTVGANSGFLAKDQDLVDVLIRDHRAMKALGITQSQLAGWLKRATSDIWSLFRINGQKIRIVYSFDTMGQALPLPGVRNSSGEYFAAFILTSAPKRRACSNLYPAISVAAI